MTTIEIPKMKSSLLAEETGIHMGDGSMGLYRNNRIGLYSLAGHPIDDREYFENYLMKIYEALYGVKPNLRKWSRAYGFQICSKELIEYKKKLGLPCGPKSSLRIPSWIKKGNIDFQRKFLRGLFDTDGSVYLEKKS